MKQTTIDSTLLPHIWLHWDTSKATFYLDTVTGEKCNASQVIADFAVEYIDGVYRRNNNIRIRPNGKKYCAYVKYHDDIEMLEIAAVTLDTSRKEEPKPWSYVSKYFIAKDKKVYDENGNIPETYELYRYHSSNKFANVLGWLDNLDHHNTKTMEEVRRFIGGNSFTISSGRIVNLYSLWGLQEWYRTSQKPRGKGKQTKLAEKLSAMPHEDLDGVIAKYNNTQLPNPQYYGSAVGVVHFEHLGDGWSVLRVLRRGYREGDFTEVERMYLHDDGTNRIVTKNGENWMPAKQMNPWGSRYVFGNRDEAMEKCKRLKYLLPMFDPKEEKIRQYIMTALRFPEVEQLMKLGYTEQAKSIANSTTAKADLRDLFGGYYNEKEKSLLKKAGLTKHQFDKLMLRQTWQSSRSLEQMRKMFGDEFIHLDNETFDGYFDAFNNVSTSLYSGYYNYCERLDLDLKKIMKNIVRLAKRNRQVYQLYCDTMSMYTRLETGTEPAVDWYFDNFSDLNRMHDAVTALYNQQNAIRQARWNMATSERLKQEEAKRIKLDEKRKEWEYEDDEYVIRLPKDAAEIIAEGTTQHMCIGGYVSSHSTGSCTLFFVRKKSEPDAPFYAIEVRSGAVIQIHGKRNCWLGNNPEAIPSVIRWLRQNKFKCAKEILTCTATGYGQTNNYIELPVVED